MKYLDSSGLSHLWARLKSFFVAKNQVVNNAATTDAGYVLDARVGKSLSDSINTKADKTLATASANGLMSASDKSKLDGIGAGSNVKSVNGKTGAVSLSKADVGLGNVDNTRDADKPYYKLIGETTNADQIGHFNFNDASRSLYKIKNFYAASGEGDYFYLVHKKLDYTITATKHFSNTAGLFTADLSSDCTIATNLISESDPAILTIVRKHEITTTDVLTLIFYEHRGWQSNARLKHWKLEIKAYGPNSPDYTNHTWKGGDWLTVFERTNVSDSINCLWCGLNPYKDDGLSYLWIKGIRITIYAATPYSTKSGDFGYNQLEIAGMRLLDSRPSFSPAEALGALDVAGGTVYGKTTFQEGISATSYSGATATSYADGLMSKADKAKLDTLEGRVNALNLSLAKLYPVGSIYLSVNDTDPGTFIGGTWELVGSGKTLWGADASHAAGTTIDAGLPNMTGWLQYAAGGYGADNSKLGGAFYADGYYGGGTNGYAGGSGNGTLYQGLHIDASRSNAIYGNSSTVQPPAYVVYIWKRTA